jgi:hypothetical protein
MDSWFLTQAGSHKTCGFRLQDGAPNVENAELCCHRRVGHSVDWSLSKASIESLMRPIGGAVEKARDEHRKKASALNPVGHI